MKRLTAALAAILISVSSFAAYSSALDKSLEPWNQPFAKRVFTPVVNQLLTTIQAAQYTSSGYPEIGFFVVLSEYTPNEPWVLKVTVETYFRQYGTFPRVWGWGYYLYEIDIAPNASSANEHFVLYRDEQHHMDPVYPYVVQASSVNQTYLGPL